MVKPISTTAASPPGGHYSQAIASQGFVFISGQLGFDPGTLERKAVTVREEVLSCLANIASILNAAGSTTDDLVKLTVFTSDISHWTEINGAFEEFLGDVRPARAIIPCGALPFGFRVEIEAVASCRTSDDC